jgi:hypothetical protein
VLTARWNKQHFPSPSTVTSTLAAEEALCSYDERQLQQQVAAAQSLWDVYGEKSTRLFHSLAKQPPQPQTINEVAAPGGSSVSATTAAGAAAAADLLADFYDSASLFAWRTPQTRSSSRCCWRLLTSSCPQSSSSSV